MTIRCHWMAVALLLVVEGTLSAKTIILTDAECERMAFVQAGAPRWSWGGYDVTSTSQSTGQFYLYQDRAFLICFPLDRVPKGQKIVKAELSFTTGVQSRGENKLALHRILTAWGAGVCWQYAAVRPAKVEWKRPGARSPGSDRAAKASAVVRTKEGGEKVVNVTEDVELWYTGAAANHGWTITLEDADAYVILQSPVWANRGSYKLRITYEPE